MTIGWDALRAGELRELAAGLRSGRLSVPVSTLALQGCCEPEKAEWLAQTLAGIAADAVALATFLDLLAAERERVDSAVRAVELVWTGPGAGGKPGRDTGAVVRELFSSARRSVLVAGYAIHRGREVFATLADRMAAVPDLQVRMIVDVPRRQGDTTIDIDIVHRYATEFRQRNWPGGRLPEVLYDPRSLLQDQAARSAMHAKCIVIDAEVALVTSANFTSAAQTKNIEAGTLVRLGGFASQVQGRFDDLVRIGVFRPLPVTNGPST
ncbi:MAG TPA: DISARM system phospholipase D-like protein DrmC [Planctomycetota bacterium]|nr:DISARM system phospholipase D-like protein DrmC [Planctomycetota bacterium]